MQLVTIVAVTRKGYFNPTAEQAVFLDSHSDKIKVIEADVIGTSSSEIRNLIHTGQDASEFIPASVLDYATAHKLY